LGAGGQHTDDGEEKERDGKKGSFARKQVEVELVSLPKEAAAAGWPPIRKDLERRTSEMLDGSGSKKVPPLSWSFGSPLF
jgi:hypothetical protein